MTIEELGLEYLRQADTIWQQIQEEEQTLVGSTHIDFVTYQKALDRMEALYEMHADLVRTGQHLIHYYDT